MLGVCFHKKNCKITVFEYGYLFIFHTISSDVPVFSENHFPHLLFLLFRDSSPKAAAE